MQNILDYIEEVKETADNIVWEMTQVSADRLGLDIRAGGRLWVSKDCIVVRKGNDRSLQYYGGFEYVDKDCRVELGDYVVYTSDDDRVRDHIEAWIYANTESEELQEEDE